jgi:RNA polymerase sigma-70 factor (ECF subfamily)
VHGTPDELALAAARGDAVAFAELVRSTEADVWRACAALVDRDSAEDLVQETYLQAHRALARFDRRSSARTWLLSIARHVCHDEIRRRTRQRRNLAVSPAPAAVADHAGGVELGIVLAALESERREAFVLTQLIGLSYLEAAQVCGCPVGTIRSRVARARTDLVQALVDDGAPTPAPQRRLP